MNVIDEINRNFSDRYDFLRISSVAFSRTKYTLDVHFLFPSVLPDGKTISDSDKEAVTNFVKSLYPKLSVFVHYHKSYCDESRLSLRIFQYIMDFKGFASFYIKKEDLKISREGQSSFKAVLSAEPHIVERFETEDFAVELKKYLAYFFCEEISVELVKKDSDSYIDISVDFDDDDYSEYLTAQKQKKIAVEVLSPVVGTKITTKPTQIKHSKIKNDNVCLCGKIATKSRLVSKSKGFPYYIMSIHDGTAGITVKSFSKSEEDTKVTNLNVGQEIICMGKLVEDEYEARRDAESKGLIMIASRICTCKIDYDTVDTTPVYRSCPSRYKNVFPEDYEDFEQVNFFSAEKIPDSLIGMHYLIFDLETTGSSTSGDQICEIGACKVENGRITQTFSTLVKPTIPMSAGATEVNHITDEMLENQPSLEEVFPDFYKFCQGCILVSYNTDFDVPFVKRACKDLSFKFDFNSEDALALARRKLSLSNYKLKTVVDKLGVSLVNAHRALADTLATAKAFIKMKGMPDK